MQGTSILPISSGLPAMNYVATFGESRLVQPLHSAVVSWKVTPGFSLTRRYSEGRVVIIPEELQKIAG